MKKKIQEMYLDWVNNFLSLERFSEYYNIPPQKAEKIINLGRILNNR